jgi:hypothetical protein
MRSVPFAFAIRIRTSGRLREAQSNPAASQPAARGGLLVRIQSLRQKGPAPFRFRGYRKRRESCISAGSFFLSKSDPLRRDPILFLVDRLGIRYERSSQNSRDLNPRPSGAKRRSICRAAHARPRRAARFKSRHSDHLECPYRICGSVKDTLFFCPNSGSQALKYPNSCGTFRCVLIGCITDYHPSSGTD